jgi:hypothetical protein
LRVLPREARRAKQGGGAEGRLHQVLKS